MNCGLLGRTLAHSYSPQIHALLGDYPYALLEKEPEEIGDFLKNGDYTGLNVTIPYKKAVIPYLDALSPEAQRLGAVNTVVRRGGRCIGHNTDHFGFRWMVKKSGLNVSGRKVLVLGSGGASNTAAAVLRQLGADVVIISRTGKNNYENLSLHADAAVIVNTTPVGMYPDTGSRPLSLDGFPALEGVLDVVYNPARTRLLLDARRRGLTAMNGLWMLVAQAKQSAEWFTGTDIDDAVIPRIYRALRLQTENIVLVGMPGCGKTTLGSLLARQMHREFADADRELEHREGRPITEILPREGEAAFRQMETRTLEALGSRSGLVIATGGGCVTRQENYDLLHQNGIVLWITRGLDSLPTDGRPLSRAGQLRQMYEIRSPMYRRFADAVVSNDGTAESALEEIRRKLEEII